MLITTHGVVLGDVIDGFSGEIVGFGKLGGSLFS